MSQEQPAMGHKRSMEMKVLAEGLSFPEGPAFAPDGALWCVELRGGNLVRFGPEGLQRIPTQGSPNGLAFDRKGRAWLCDAGQNAIRCYDPHTGGFETIVARIDGQPLAKPNDLIFDAAGNLLFTCPDDSSIEPTGYVCCLKTAGGIVRIAEKLCFPNGLALTPDGRDLVVAETFRRRLWRGAWEPRTWSWTGAHGWADVGGPAGPDGMAFGADGCLYVAVFGTGLVKIVARTGRILDVLEVPGRQPTNVAFDPKGKLGLVVTEAERGLLVSFPQFGPGAPLYDGGANWL